MEWKQNKYIWVAVVVGIIVIGLWIWTIPNESRDNKTIRKQIESGQITSFSLSGSVNKIQEGKIYLQTGSVRTTNRGEEFVPEEKVITFSAKTEVTSGAPAKSALIADIKASNTITVETSQNPAKSVELLADKIHINNP